MGKLFYKNNQKGQILLIVVLAAVVSLTVGLAAVSRTITNTKVSTDEANSQKALSAAEAGVEKLITSSDVSLGSSGTLSNNANFDAKATSVEGSSPIELNGGRTVSQDDGADVWLSRYSDYANQWPSSGTGTLTVYWTDNDNADCTKNAAIEVILISGTDKNNPQMDRYAYDACGARQTSNIFSIPGNGITINGKVYKNSFTINSITNGFIARVIPLYADANIAVKGDNLPSQGEIIESVGKSRNTTRVVRVFRGYPKLPIEFFPYNLFLP